MVPRRVVVRQGSDFGIAIAEARQVHPGGGAPLAFLRATPSRPVACLRLVNDRIEARPLDGTIDSRVSP